MKRLLLFFICFSLFFVHSLYGQTAGKISGTAIDLQTEKPVAKVLIKLQGTKYSQFSDANGKFSFPNLPAGTYHLIAIKEEYYITVVPKIQLGSGRTAIVKVEMIVGVADRYVHMALGGVTVTEDRLLVPENYQTVYKIDSGEIEHLQATSLRDVLDLIPGVVRGEGDVPGLARSSKVQLRSAGRVNTWGLFGTQVIVDDIPMDNNANRQTGVGVGYGAKVQPTGNTGVDLRRVAADNIESVEVMPGLASAEYGDFTDGIIKVKTKTGEIPMRLKIKNNPDTKDFSFMGGRNVGATLVNYMMNYAYSERDLRRKGDEVKRLVGEFKFRNRFFKNNAFTMMHKIHFYRMFDDDQDPNDPDRTTAFNRDYNISYGGKFYWNPTAKFNLESINYFRYTRRKSYRRKLEKVDIRPVTGSEVAGTFLPVDTLTGAYMSEVNTLGKEFNIGIKLQGRYRIDRLFGWKHQILGGAEYNYDVNTGKGKMFDPLLPPGGSLTIRPYPFDQEPGISGLSFYFEDRLEGNLLRPVKISLGLRYDLYDPYRLFGDGALIDSHQGSFLNPRLGILYKLFSKTQLRAGYGTVAKRPSIGLVYNQPYFRDLLDIGVVDGDSVQLVSTYIYDRTNPEIKGYRQRKYSLGLDQEIGSVGISVTGYYQKSENSPGQIGSPFILHHYFYPDFLNNPTERVAIDTVFINYSATNPYTNTGWSEKYGVEFSLNTRRIERLNMKFRISAAYNYQTSGRNDPMLSSPRMIHYSNANTGSDEDLMVFPFFDPVNSRHDRLVVNYYLDYFARPLSIWVTLSAQNVMLARYRSYPPSTNYHALGFHSIHGATYISKAEAEKYDLMRHPGPLAEEIIKVPGNKWLFSLNVSKSLFSGSELSLYVINFLNDLSWYISPYTGRYRSRNPQIYYGIEFSSELDKLWRIIK